MDEWRSNCDIPTAEYPENKADLDINDGEEPPKAAAQQLSHFPTKRASRKPSLFIALAVIVIFVLVYLFS